jgi:hypothetical protein
MKWLSVIGSKAKVAAIATLGSILFLMALTIDWLSKRVRTRTLERDAAIRSTEALKKANETSAKIREASKQAQELAAKRERETKPTTTRPTGNFGDDRLK